MMRLYAYKVTERLPLQALDPVKHGSVQYAVHDLGKVDGLELIYAVTVKEVKLERLSRPERAVWFHYGNFGLTQENL